MPHARRPLPGLRATFAPLFFLSLSLYPPVSARAMVSDGTWRKLYETVNAVSPGRRSAAMVFDSPRNRLVLFGGWRGSMPMSNEVWVCAMETGVWSQITPTGVPPAPRIGATAIYEPVGQRLILFGGRDGLSQQRNDVWALSLDGTPQWTELAAAGVPPPGRAYHVAIYDSPRQRMVIHGGWDTTEYFDDVWTLSLSGPPVWAEVTSFNAPPGRARSVAAYDALRQQMIVFGGWNGLTSFDQTWILPLQGNPTWSMVAATDRPSGRYESAGAYDPVNDRFVIQGGIRTTVVSNSHLSDAYELSLSNPPAWQPVPTTSRSPGVRSGHSAVYDPVGLRIIFAAGGDATGVSTRSLSWLSLAGTPQWDDVPVPAFSPISSHSMVLDPVDRKLLLFGGGAGVGSNALLECDLNAATLRWLQVPVGGAWPSTRYGHRAVWDPDGDRMLVFGGVGGLFLNDLWEYRPRPTPTWTLLNTTAAPPRRFAGGLILDRARHRLIVFGGYRDLANNTGPYIAMNDLWALPLTGPDAMVWQPLTSTDPPTPRHGFSMDVDASGQHAWVFGGSASSDGRLPSTGYWPPTNELWDLDLSVTPMRWSNRTPHGTPTITPRMDHVSVMDPINQRIVIFGGSSGTALMNDCWAFNILGGIGFQRLMPSGAASPVARFRSAAVYDPSASRLLLAAGSMDGQQYADTWELAWDQTVPVSVSLASSHAAPDRVELEWFARDATSVAAMIERRTADEEWLVLGPAEVSGTDRLRFEDRTVVAGTSYRYRLALQEGGAATYTEETWIDVPSVHRLELVGARPNPAEGDRLSIALSLARRGAARLELIDVTGRRVAERDLGGYEPGRHLVTLGESGRLEPGVYVIRLSTEGRVLTAKAAVVR